MALIQEAKLICESYNKFESELNDHLSSGENWTIHGNMTTCMDNDNCLVFSILLIRSYLLD